ncbi:hypothetical protein [Nostoc sp.]|uniref:hypothetical protein n=1 Tax=Nostoc sp. TaxID=1180 RepID=UPI002FFBCDC1
MSVTSIWFGLIVGILTGATWSSFTNAQVTPDSTLKTTPKLRSLLQLNSRLQVGIATLMAKLN